MMLTVIDTPGVSVLDVRCPTTVVSDGEEIQGRDRFEVIFVRAGCFSFRDSRGEVLVDPITCVLGSPRRLAEIAHPAPGGDVYTQVTLSADVWHQLTFDEQVPLTARVSGAMQVAVRSMVAAGRRGEHEMAIEEEALNLVAAAVSFAEPVRMVSGRPRSDRARRQLAEDARAMLISDPALSSVREIAGRLDCSPGHLSRLFHAYTGMTLAGYRTRLRLNLALQLLADGGTSIAEAAAQCGFSDQAHLNRTLRHHTGSTPGRVRSAIK
jgi:AraC-like DNA-binding protein